MTMDTRQSIRACLSFKIITNLEMFWTTIAYYGNSICGVRVTEKWSKCSFMTFLDKIYRLVDKRWKKVYPNISRTSKDGCDVLGANDVKFLYH